MTLNPKRSPFLFSLLWSWLALLLASFALGWDLPIIHADPLTAWFLRFDPNEGSLWLVLEELPDALSRSDVSGTDWLRQQWGNLMQLIVVLTVGAVFGRLLYWRLWERGLRTANVSESPPQQQS